MFFKSSICSVLGALGYFFLFWLQAMITKYEAISSRKMPLALQILTRDKTMVAMSDYGDEHRMLKKLAVVHLLNSNTQVGLATSTRKLELLFVCCLCIFISCLVIVHWRILQCTYVIIILCDRNKIDPFEKLICLTCWMLCSWTWKTLVLNPEVLWLMFGITSREIFSPSPCSR